MYVTKLHLVWTGIYYVLLLHFNQFNNFFLYDQNLLTYFKYTLNTEIFYSEFWQNFIFLFIYFDLATM